MKCLTREWQRLTGKFKPYEVRYHSTYPYKYVRKYPQSMHISFHRWRRRAGRRAEYMNKCASRTYLEFYVVEHEWQKN